MSYQYSFGLNCYMFPKSVEVTAVLHFTAGFFSASLMVPFHYGVSGRSCCSCTGSHFAIGSDATHRSCPRRNSRHFGLSRPKGAVATAQPRPGCPFVVILLAALVRVIGCHTVRGNHRVDSFPPLPFVILVVGDFLLVEPYGDYASTTTATTASHGQFQKYINKVDIMEPDNVAQGSFLRMEV